MQKLIHFIFLVLCLFYSTNTCAQVKGDYNWLMGINLEDTGPFDGILLDFNHPEIEFELIEKSFNFHITATSMSDDDGNLLFYTNGCDIANAQHEIMDNGDEITPGYFHEDQCDLIDRGYPLTQGILSLPYPGQENVYALLHQKVELLFDVPNLPVYADGLYVTTIDMNLNNGLGTVVAKNEIIYADSLDLGLLTATKHSNGQDWWILQSDRFSNRIYRILFSADGFELVGFQDIDAAVILNPGDGGGQAVFSPDGTRYARYSGADELRLFDFDRSTGELSNFQLIQIPPDTLGVPPATIGGLSFSPSGRFLYCSSWEKIHQVDVEANDVQASVTKVAHWDGFYVDNLAFLPGVFGYSQLAPDCRIYITMFNTTNILHVIHEPDKKGEACNVQQHIQLPAWNSGTIPNFPNYRLDIAPVCNPNIELLAVDTVVSVATAPVSAPDKVWVYPNPAQEYLQLAVQLPDTAPAEWVLTDALGQPVRHQNIHATQQLQEITLDISNLPSGVYFWKLVADGVLRKSGRVVVQE